MNLPKTNYHLDNENPVMKVFWGRVDIEYASAFLKFSKKGSTQKLLHKLKYQGRKDIGEFIGKWYATVLNQVALMNEMNGIIPIPLHPEKEKKRGYNQSYYFGLGLSRGLNIPVRIDLVKRVVNTKTQTKKARFDRWENVKSIFEVTNNMLVKDKNFIVVDDVITTGATMEACIKTLKDAGAGKIAAISIAAT